MQTYLELNRAVRDKTPVGNIYLDTSRAHEVEIVDHDKRKKNRALELLQKNFKAIMDQEGRK